MATSAKINNIGFAGSEKIFNMRSYLLRYVTWATGNAWAEEVERDERELVTEVSRMYVIGDPDLNGTKRIDVLKGSSLWLNIPYIFVLVGTVHEGPVSYNEVVVVTVRDGKLHKVAEANDYILASEGKSEKKRAKLLERLIEPVIDSQMRSLKIGKYDDGSNDLKW